MFNTLLHTYRTWKNQGLKTCMIVNIHTEGSTYTKAGAVMLVNETGSAVGLISGGCLEGELINTALTCIRQKISISKTYDLTSDADDLWGSGSGCRGLTRVLFITEAGNSSNYLPEMLENLSTKNMSFYIPVENLNGTVSGIAYREIDFLNKIPNARAFSSLAEQIPWRSGQLLEIGNIHFFCLKYVAPLRMLILGGGPDAVPLINIAKNLDWKITLVDHRNEFLSGDSYAGVDGKHHLPDANLKKIPDLKQIDAVIIKSHHYETDKKYAEQIFKTDIPYIGLLGPNHRREKTLKELNINLISVKDRLFSPAGINIKSYDPGAIAVSVIAEILIRFYGSHDQIRN